MELSEDQLNQLERYLLDTMSASERSEFEIEINASTELQEFVNIYTSSDEILDTNSWSSSSVDANERERITTLFKSKDVINFTEKLKQAEERTRTQSTSKDSKETKGGILRYLLPISGVAAAVILLFTLLPSISSSSLDDLYAENSSWNELPSLINKSGNDEALKVQLSSSFTQKDYVKSEELSSSLISNSKETLPNILLYLGISQLELEKYPESLSTFNQLIQSNTLDNHKGYWYSALVYFKLNDADNAKKMLDTIISNPNYYNHEKAKELRTLVD